MVALLLAAVCSTSPCVDEHVFVVPSRQRVVITPPQVFYFVGAPYRLQALRGGPPVSGEPATVGEPSLSAISTLCRQCHGETEPKGGFNITGDLTPEQTLRAVRKMASGEMPPNRTLSRELKNRVLVELLEPPVTEEPEL